ncbi:MAG: polyphosphate:AMP phosphotransferase [Candidatus Accumulibacter sp.]|jgi:polyphosphate:AMP phosphotransferase|nr:polyphosphate:AMP phosphotransferase [Accumulibacter sp.]
MFESAELGHTVDKETFKEEVPRLRAALLDAQFEHQQKAAFPIVLLISGLDGAGKGETINILHEWMDPRFILTRAFSDPSEEERKYPYMWRFWQALPPKGRIGIFSGSWYSEPISRQVTGKQSDEAFHQYMDQINRFEAMLVNEGALVLKFWFHLPKEGQRQRLKALEKDPRTAWRVTKMSWERTKTYDKLQDAAGQVLRVTNSPWAPWVVVEGTDDRYRSLTVGRIILDAMQKRLADERDQNFPVAPPITLKATDSLDVLTALDLSKKLDKSDYKTQLARWQGRLSELARRPEFAKHALILAFEGMDAAGKGGSIRRVTAALDARQYQVVPIAAPTEEERAQPYLWRFWRQVPRVGRITIFDRTWYGRVLVERVESFCSEADWLRAYSEINDFENELYNDGVIVVKFWLQISPEEQLLRFQEREKIEFKRFKITDEDWRNREKIKEYHAAVCDMVDRTSTSRSPWTLVEAEDKNYARIRILATLCERLEKILDVKCEKGKPALCPKN